MRSWNGASPCVAILLILTACGARRPAMPPPACGVSAEAALACAQQREEAITTLRSVFTATSEHNGDRYTTRGVLLVSKPDRFRLRLMLPVGFTVFDCIGSDGHLHLSLPLHGRHDDAGGGTSAPLPFQYADLAEAFLRGAHAFPGACVAARDSDEVVVQCGDAGVRRWRRLVLDPASTFIRDEISYGDAALLLTLRYEDYQPTDGIWLPRRIILASPRSSVSLDIVVERYEINPDLPADLFQPPAP